MTEWNEWKPNTGKGTIYDPDKDWTYREPWWFSLLRFVLCVMFLVLPLGILFVAIMNSCSE